MLPTTFLLLVSACAGAEEPTANQAAWLVSPRSNEDNLLVCPNVTFGRSNNNLALKVYRDRLYLAVRSAPHHYPKPPVWAAGEAYSGDVRLYVVSMSFKEEERERFLSGWPNSWWKAVWRLEFEVADRLEQERFAKLRRRLSNPHMRKEAFHETCELIGESAAQFALERDGYLCHCDWREPIFFELNGSLHFLCMQIAGVAMAFEPLRAWHTRIGGDGSWEYLSPALEVSDHFWDVQSRHEGSCSAAYITLAHGGHYQFGAAASSKIDILRSVDGKRWSSVSTEGAIDRGRACEPAFGLAPDGRTAWMLLRLEDADPRGWGSLLGRAEEGRLDQWSFPKKANPQRFDSARFFSQGSSLYVVARQNIGRVRDGSLCENVNHPYAATNFLPVSGDLRTLAHMAEYGTLPKRTALYFVDQDKQELRRILTLPSAGDTAFPAVERLDKRTVLVANYSSALDKRDMSWLEGQNHRTGIYFVLLRFPNPPH